VYARYFLQNQDVSPRGTGTFLADDIRAYTFGGDYRVGNFFFTAEHEIHDSTVLPFEATRLSAQYMYRAREDLTLSVSGYRTMIEYTDTGTSTDVTTVSGHAIYRPARNLYATASVTWLLQSDETESDTTGWEQYLTIRWKHRQTEIFGILRNATLETDSQDNSFLLLQVGVERRF
jgi:hypothetical protein